MLLSHLISLGFIRRILFDRLSALDRVIGYDFLPKPVATGTFEVLLLIDELVRSFSDILCRRRALDLASTPLIEDWVIPALQLYIWQPDHPPLSILQFAFGPPDHPQFQRLLRRCRNADVVSKFREIENGTVRRGSFAPAERLLRSVLSSPAFAARCGSTFSLPAFLDRGGILIVEGGGNISEDAQRTIMGALILQTIRYVRSRPRPYPEVILVLDEATNANLIGASGYEMRAAAETQKMGLALHVLVQSLNFPSTDITEGMLNNCLRHEWFFAANEAVIRKAAADLGSKDFEPDLRNLQPGERFVKDRSRVFREYVPMLEDRWGFPGLAKKKAERALEEIKRRPEYRTPLIEAVPAAEDSASRREPPASDPEPPENDNPNMGI
jgi:hypothetical protein